MCYSPLKSLSLINGFLSRVHFAPAASAVISEDRGCENYSGFVGVYQHQWKVGMVTGPRSGFAVLWWVIISSDCILGETYFIDIWNLI